MDDELEIGIKTVEAVLEKERPIDSSDPEWMQKADHVFTKADARLTEDVETATEYLMTRGHPEEDARALAEYLQRAKREEAKQKRTAKSTESQQLSSVDTNEQLERSPFLVDGGGVDLDGDDVDGDDVEPDETAAFDGYDPFLWA